MRRLYNPRVERLSYEQLRELQTAKVREAVGWAYERSAFYRRRFNEHGVTPGDVRTLEDFSALLPITSKREFLDDQRDNPPHGSAVSVPPQSIIRYMLTSGTSGVGQEVHAVTTADAEYGTAWKYGFHWAGLEPGDVFASTLPLSTGNLSGPDTVIASAIRGGLNLQFLGHLPADQKLRMMQRFRPKAVFVVPAYLQRLTQVAYDLDIEPRDLGVEVLFIATEPYTVEWAQRMQTVWGCWIGELYGSTQAGTAAAFTCEAGAIPGGQRGMIHWLGHLIYVEVVDRETRQPVTAGAAGELVVTPLERVGTPIIRWATDDKVTLVRSADCGCGRPFDGVRAGQISRYDDMIKINAVNVWPEAVDAIIFADTGIAEYQAEVGQSVGGTEVRVRIEFTDGAADRDRRMRGLEERLRREIGVTMKLMEADEPLPRFDFKSRRWTDQRSDDRQRMIYAAL